MVPALIVLLCSQLAGELVARLLQLPVPGPVLGLLFLFAVLLARGRTAETVGGTARVLLGNLALLFVPAGVGLVRHGARLRMEWLATFALAVPLYENRAEVRRALLPMIAALLAGSAVAVLSAVGIAAALGASGETVASIAPKSVTAPIAMAISEQIGGQPSLTAAMV